MNTGYDEFRAPDAGNSGSQEEDASAVETVYLPEDSYTPSKDYSKVGFGVVTFYVIWEILVIIMGVLYFKISGLETISTSYAVSISVMSEILSIPLLLFFTKKISYEPLEKRRLGAGEIFVNLCIVFFLGIAGNIIGTVVNSVIYSGGGNPSVSMVGDFLAESFGPVMVLYTALVGPVIEELLFRKVIIDKLYRYGKPVALVTSGLLFALVHGNLEQFFYAFFVGCFLAYIYIKTGNIKYTIILHILMNSFSVVLTYLLTKIPLLGNVSGDTSEVVKMIMKDNEQLTCLMIMIALVILEYGMALIGLIVSVMRYKSFSFDEESPRRASVKKCWFNPGMLICITVLAGLMILKIFGISI